MCLHHQDMTMSTPHNNCSNTDIQEYPGTRPSRPRVHRARHHPFSTTYILHISSHSYNGVFLRIYEPRIQVRYKLYPYPPSTTPSLFCNRLLYTYSDTNTTKKPHQARSARHSSILHASPAWLGDSVQTTCLIVLIQL